MINYSMASIVCWVYSQPPIKGLSFNQEEIILKAQVWKEIFDLDSIQPAVVTIYVKEPRPIGVINKTDERIRNNKNSIQQFQLSCTLSPQGNTSRDLNWSWTMSNGTDLYLNSSHPPPGTQSIDIN